VGAVDSRRANRLVVRGVLALVVLLLVGLLASWPVAIVVFVVIAVVTVADELFALSWVRHREP
jgi:hypothetical protein